MERSEPALVPEWLKTSSGSVAGSAGSNNQSASSFLHSDDHSVSRHARNRSSISITDHDIGRSSFSDRTTSSYFRRSSSGNGSSHLRSYGSFGRSQRDRDWNDDISDYHDKDKSVLGNQRHRDYSDHLGSILPSRFEKDVLRRTHSTLTARRGDTLPKKVPGDSKNGNKSNHSNGDSLLSGVSVISNVHKSAFERDFPSLGTEERQVGSEVGRVPSPGLSNAIQSLPVGSSALIGGDGWTSALVEVPGAIGSNSMSVASSQQTVSASSLATPSSLTAGLNMAETVAQGPPRARTPPQLSVETQRLEELAMKQSRQLIPVTPSMPKTSVLSPSEKVKPKIGHQHASQPASLTFRGGPARSDVPKTALGKLHVLKPSRELNGVSSTAKDSLSPTNGSKVVNSPLGVPLSTAGSIPLRSPSNTPNISTVEQKPSTFSKAVEKKLSSQAQSRNDFFNLLKKKSSTNSPSLVPCSGPAVPSSTIEQLDEVATKSHALVGTDAPSSDTSVLDLSTKNRDEIIQNGDGCDASQKVIGNGEKHSTRDAIIHPYEEDEEEVAFLRSLGWEENAGDDEGLTEEEINGFYEYLKLRPSLKLREVTPKIAVPLHLQNGNCCSHSSESSSSGCESES